MAWFNAQTSGVAMDSSNFCKKCAHAKTCQVPCRPVLEDVTIRSGAPVMEKKNGGAIIVFPQKNQRRFSEMPLDWDPEDIEDKKQDTQETLDFHPERDRAAVFFKRFFQRKDYETIAGELGISIELCRSHYAQSKKQILKILTYLDRQRFAVASFTEMRNRLPKEKILFLMVRVWGLTVPEIKKFWPEKISKSQVHRAVKKVQKQIT